VFLYFESVFYKTALIKLASQFVKQDLNKNNNKKIETTRHMFQYKYIINHATTYNKKMNPSHFTRNLDELLPLAKQKHNLII